MIVAGVVVAVVLLVVMFGAFGNGDREVSELHGFGPIEPPVREYDDWEVGR